MSMAFTIYIMVLSAFGIFVATNAAEDLGGIAPAPMESIGAALGVPVLPVAAVASLLAWFL